MFNFYHLMAEESDKNRKKERIFFEFVIGSLPYIILFVASICRFCRHWSTELNDAKMKMPYSLKFKIGTTTLLALFILSKGLLLYFFENQLFLIREESFDLYSLIIFLLHFVVLVIQIYIMFFEFSRKLPNVWYLHLLFCILIFITSILLMIDSLFFFPLSESYFSFFFDAAYFVLSSLLLGLGVKYKQDLGDFTEVLKDKLLFPSINRRLNYEEKKLKEVKNFTTKIYVFQNNEHDRFTIKIDLTDIQYELQTNISTIQHLFLTLPQDQEGFGHFDSNDLSVQKIEEKFNFYFENEVYLTKAMIQFLQIPNPYKKILLKKIKKNSINGNEELSMLSYSSQDTHKQTKNKRFGLIFFDVSIRNYRKSLDRTHFDFEFYLTFLPNNAIITLFKRYNEFAKLEESLKKFHKYVPKLPMRNLLIQDDENLDIRGKCLEEYLLFILNEPIYYNSEIILDFLKISEQKPHKSDSLITEIWLLIKNTDIKQLISNVFINCKANIYNEKLFYESQEKQFVVYFIKISKFNENKKEFEEFSNVIKRYSDFEKLYEYINCKYEGVEMLPKKYGFQKILQIENRRIGLENFLNNALRIREVGEAYFFRKFLEINTFKNYQEEGLFDS